MGDEVKYPPVVTVASSSSAGTTEPLSDHPFPLPFTPTHPDRMIEWQPSTSIAITPRVVPAPTPLQTTTGGHTLYTNTSCPLSTSGTLRVTKPHLRGPWTWQTPSSQPRVHILPSPLQGMQEPAFQNHITSASHPSWVGYIVNTGKQILVLWVIKLFTMHGRQRWPLTNSLCKSLCWVDKNYNFQLAQCSHSSLPPAPTGSHGNGFYISVASRALLMWDCTQRAERGPQKHVGAVTGLSVRLLVEKASEGNWLFKCTTALQVGW